MSPEIGNGGDASGCQPRQAGTPGYSAAFSLPKRTDGLQHVADCKVVLLPTWVETNKHPTFLLCLFLFCLTR